MFGDGADDAGPRRRPHRLPADARREPARVERQPDDRARHARAGCARSARAAARSSSSTRAARRPPRRPTSTSSSARAPTRYFLFALVHVLVRRGPRATSARLRRPRDRPRRGRARSRRAFTPEARGAGRAASTPTTIRRIARELAAARARRRLRPHRHLHAGVRHARALARRRAQRAHRQPRPRGRRDVHAAPPPGGQHRRGAAGRGRGRRASAAGTAACAGCPRSSASCRSRAWPRRSRRPARARSARSSRSPATRCSRRRTPAASSARSTSLDFMVSVDIYLNETTRHADVILPGAVAARARPLRPRALPARGPQRRELLAAGRRRSRADELAGVGDPAAPRRRSPAGQGATPTSSRARRLRRCSARCRRRSGASGVDRRGPRRRRARSRCSSARAAAPSACST